MERRLEIFLKECFNNFGNLAITHYGKSIMLCEFIDCDNQKWHK